MRFFEPRFPRNIMEGAAKGLLLGGLLLTTYEAFSPTPQSSEAITAHSQSILDGYFVFTVLGMLCGAIGQVYLEDRDNEQNVAPGF